MPRRAPARPPRRRLVDAVIERLERQIALGAFAPGDRLPTETELTDSFGVSRTTIREAVGALSHAGLVDVRQGDGTYVAEAPPGRESLDVRLRRATALDVYEVRRPLEVEAAKLAAERRSAADIRRLRSLLAERDRLRDAGDTARAVDVDVEFHGTVATASRNAVLADVYRAFSSVLRETLVGIGRDTVALTDTTDLHYALVDAIEAGDANRASAVTEALLETDAAELRRAVEGGDRASPPARRPPARAPRRAR